MAVLQLVEDGKLALDSTLESFIPGFPNGDSITVRQLLGHTSGIPSDVHLEGFRERNTEALTLEEAVDWVRRNAHPRFEPGARFDYSNTGNLLLSRIVEMAAGVPFERYLTDHVFAPAGMKSSGLDSSTRLLPGRARGYSRSERGEVVNAPYRYPSFGWGCGALYSTAEDLWRFDRALMDGRRCGRGSHEPGFHALQGTFRSNLLDRPGDAWTPLLDDARTSSAEPLSVLAGKYEMEDGAIRDFRVFRGRLEFGDPSAGTFFPGYALSDSEGSVAELNARLRFRKMEGGGIDLLALHGNPAWSGHCSRRKPGHE